VADEPAPTARPAEAGTSVRREAAGGEAPPAPVTRRLVRDPDGRPVRQERPSAGSRSRSVSADSRAPPSESGTSASSRAERREARRAAAVARGTGSGGPGSRRSSNGAEAGDQLERAARTERREAASEGAGSGRTSRRSTGETEPREGIGSQLLPPLPRVESPQKTSRFYSGAAASRRLEATTRASAEQAPAMNASTYAYNEENGLLTTAGGGVAPAGRTDTVYVEQPTNRFKRVTVRDKEPGLLGRLWQRRAPEAEDEWGPADDTGGQIAVLQKMVDGFQSFAAYVSLLSQGLLGGLGFTNLMMTYFSSPNINLTGFLRYYSPMAMVLNRFYYVLVCFALVATINKYARNTMWDWKPYGSRQRAFDAVLVVLYFIAFVISVVITPYDDLLTYNSMRIPDYYDMALTDDFMSKLQVWHALSVTRMVLVFVAWALAALEFSPISTMVYWRFTTQPRPGGVPIAMQRLPDGSTVPVVSVPGPQGAAESAGMGSLDRRTLGPIPGNTVMPDGH